MSSTRTAPRTAINRSSSSSLNTHHTNGSANAYEANDSSNTSDFDSNLQRSVLTKNLPNSDGIYKNPRFMHQISVGLMGQPVVIQTNEQERYHGILETISPTGDVLLSLAHRIENHSNDITTLSTALIDLVDTMESSTQAFELQKRVIPSANIVEMIAIDMDITGSGKCILDEAPKVTQLEDDRFNRMEHFYGGDDIDAETFEELDLGDDGKAGYDPEDMFTTNKEKFNTRTDFDENKYTNVPLRELSAEEQAELDKKVSEVERGVKSDDIDEDDAGVKRPSEYSQSQGIDDGSSGTKPNQPSRLHSNNERRSDFRPDADYNPQNKRGGWRDQRGASNANRRGGQSNYSMNNPKGNQPQYTSSRSSEQTAANRSQQYNKPRNTNRYQENLSPHEGRDSPSQMANEETSRPQRMNSGSFSQGQTSGPTSPSTNAPARTIYGRNSGQPIGRNSPAPYTGSSSSRNNSTNATSSPPPSSTSYQGNTAGTGNYAQQANNKMNNKKQLRNDQQQTNEDNEQPKPQRNQQQQQQQQQQPNSANNQSNTAPPTRPSQLHTQQVKQQQQPQAPTSSSNNTNVPPPLTLPNQDDHSSSHETINPNQLDPSTHLTNVPPYSQHGAGATTPGNAKGNSGLNPEADEFVPVFTRESNSRPESRGASTSSVPVNSYLSHPHPQALHLLQQQAQQAQVQQQSMIPPSHPQNTTLYQPFYQAQFPGMQQFVNAAPQPMNVGMIGTAMMPPQNQQPLQGNGLNAANPNPTGMTTPNGGAGPGYKPNNSSAHGGDAGNTNVNNTAPKKAVVSVQRPEQSNVPQQQQVAGGPPMVYPAAPVRYFSPEYMPQPTTPQSMQLQQIPFYYPINTSVIQAAAAAAGVGPHPNIMIPSTGSSAGPGGQVPPSLYYQGGVYPDPRVYGMYPSAASVNPGGVNQSWQMARSPPHQQPQQQQPSDQQRGYGGGQNVVAQAPSQSGAPNTNNGGGGGRSASTSGPSSQSAAGAGGPPMTPQYALNGNIQAAYAYAPQTAWYSAQSQVSSPQTNMPPSVNTYGMMFDPSQQAPQQPPTYVHQNPYEAAAYFQQAQQQQQQQSSQQGLDTVPAGNYNR